MTLRKAPERAGDMDPDFSHTLLGGRAGLSALADALELELAQRGVPPATVASVLIAADEVLSNILDHGGAAPSVEVAVQVRGGRVAVQIVDDGVAFDPMAAAAPDTGLSVEDRQIGGLGIHLVRKLMDEVGYDRSGKHNRLRFSKRYSPTSASRQPSGESS